MLQQGYSLEILRFLPFHIQVKMELSVRATEEETPEEQVVEESVEPETKTPRRTLQGTPTKYELYFA